MMDKKQAVHFLQMHYDVVFPYGYSNISKGVLGDDMFMTIGLIENQMDCSSNIRMNDIGLGRFRVTIEGDNYVLERLQHALTCNPTDKYCALSLQRINYRKIKAKNIDDLVKKFDKYLTKWVNFVNEKVEAKEVYNQEKYDIKYFMFNDIKRGK